MLQGFSNILSNVFIDVFKVKPHHASNLGLLVYFKLPPTNRNKRIRKLIYLSVLQPQKRQWPVKAGSWWWATTRKSRNFCCWEKSDKHSLQFVKWKQLLCPESKVLCMPTMTWIR